MVRLTTPVDTRSARAHARKQQSGVEEEGGGSCKGAPKKEECKVPTQPQRKQKW